MTKGYRLIALDLDDTLLREDLTISDRTCSALLGAQARGVRVCLVSGRPTGAIWRYARQLKLDRFGGFIVSFNGAAVIACRTGAAWFEQALPREQIHELFDLSVRHGVYIHSYLGNKIITPRTNPYTEIEGQLTGMEVVEVASFKAAMHSDAVKAMLLEEPSILKELSCALKPVVGDRMRMCISKPFFLEFTGKGIDKGRSLRWLIERLGLSPDEMIAVGDSYNDVEMLELAGLGVCMANGPAEVQARADYVTASNMEEGVAKAVERFVLRKPRHPGTPRSVRTANT